MRVCGLLAVKRDFWCCFVLCLSYGNDLMCLFIDRECSNSYRSQYYVDNAGEKFFYTFNVCDNLATIPVTVSSRLCMCVCVCVCV